MNKLDIERALRHIIANLDYDLYKRLNSDPEDGHDHFPELVDEFVSLIQGDYE